MPLTLPVREVDLSLAYGQRAVLGEDAVTSHVEAGVRATVGRIARAEHARLPHEGRRTPFSGRGGMWTKRLAAGKLTLFRKPSLYPGQPQEKVANPEPSGQKQIGTDSTDEALIGDHRGSDR
jgi:hypothetical protein